MRTFDQGALASLALNIRITALRAVHHAQSGHPGGSLSSADYLAVLFGIYYKKGDHFVVSNGHISPAVYGLLSELGIYSREEVVSSFRQNHSAFEGHCNRDVALIDYSTGPLGSGSSAALGFSIADTLRSIDSTTYLILGDGECQEGQVHEFASHAATRNSDKIIAFIDQNNQQLSGALLTRKTYSLRDYFETLGWFVLEVDGHNIKKLSRALCRAHKHKGPVCIIGKTVMGKGVSFMESEALHNKSTWHGSALNNDQLSEALLELGPYQTHLYSQLNLISPKIKTKKLRPSSRRIYDSEQKMDCRSAYGNALLDLCKNNKHVVAMTADLSGSVKTQSVSLLHPEQHIDVGISEQHMMGVAGGLSLSGFIPFASTFGVFATSRARDQVRLNDINRAPVKIVSTHCGLSVGQDGPTHQAIDDLASMNPLVNMQTIEPIDANHCDVLTRYIAQEPGHFYMRMGRHKLPIITKSNGQPYFDNSYTYAYGKTDLLRRGSDILLIASGSTACEALAACELLRKQNISAAVLAVSSTKHFDRTFIQQLKKHPIILSVEDHLPDYGLGSAISRTLLSNGITPQYLTSLGPTSYQLSGTQKELYALCEIDADGIFKAAMRALKK